MDNVYLKVNAEIDSEAVLDALDAEDILQYLERRHRSDLVEWAAEQHKEEVLDEIGEDEAISYFGIQVAE
jgi:hypothetical protein